MRSSLKTLAVIATLLVSQANGGQLLRPVPIFSDPDLLTVTRQSIWSHANKSMFCQPTSVAYGYALYNDWSGLAVKMGIYTDPGWSRLIVVIDNTIQMDPLQVIGIADYGPGFGQFKRPVAVVVSNEVYTNYSPPHFSNFFNFYVADRENDRITHVKYEFYPNETMQVVREIEDYRLYRPEDIDNDNRGTWNTDDDDVIWAVTGTDRLVGYVASTGSNVAAYGGSGSGNGQFLSPIAVAVGITPLSHNENNNIIYVVDRGNSRIVQILWTGSQFQWIEEWRNQYAGYVTDIDVDYFGQIWATTNQATVLKFTSGLEPIGIYAPIAEPDRLDHPNSICDGGGYAGWMNTSITESWDDDSGVRYYIGGTQINDLNARAQGEAGNCQVIITFSLAEYSMVDVIIRNMSGTIVRTLREDEPLASAVQSIIWDARNNSGQNVPAGEYQVQVSALAMFRESYLDLGDTKQDVVSVCDATGCTFLVGDADGNGLYTISDAVYLITYIFGGGPAPAPHALGSGDADCSMTVTISDCIKLIDFVFAGGPPPGDSDGFPPADCECSDY